MLDMMQGSDAPSREDIEQRAIKFIRSSFGSLSDLPQPVVPVIWVTVYRCMEVAMTAEAAGGPKALVKSMFLDGGRLARKFEASTHRLKLLRDMIPIIRSNRSRATQVADSQLLTDLLKWGILDAGSMSGLRRTPPRCLMWVGGLAQSGAGRSAIPFRRTLGGEQGWRGEPLSTPTAAEGGGRRPAFTKACLASHNRPPRWMG